jgi:hypothetical protein
VTDNTLFHSKGMPWSWVKIQKQNADWRKVMEKLISKIVTMKRRYIVHLLVVVTCALLLGGCEYHATANSWQPGGMDGVHRQATISATELRKILISHFGLTRIILTDEIYTLPNNGKVSDVANSQFVYCNEHLGDLARPKGWDCDDFAVAAMVPMRNYAFGTMFAHIKGGKSHALNVFVNQEHEVVLWEPQTCQYSRDQFDRPSIMIF